MKCSEKIKCAITRGLLFSLFVLQFVLPAAIEILKVPYAISYVYDLIWMLLLCVAVIRRPFHIARDVKVMLLWIIAFIAYVTVNGVAGLQSFFYFLWAFRNNFRVYVVFFAVILFSEKEDWKHYSSLIDLFLTGSFIACLIQYFILGLRNDYVGGLFGTSIGCNGYMNLFLCIAVTKSVILNFHGHEKLWRTGLIVFFSLAIATLSELKFFYIEFAFIMLVSACITPYSKKKLYILSSAVLLCVAGIGCLYVIYPVFRNFFSIEKFTNIFFSSSYSTDGDLNRLTGYATVVKKFLNTPLRFIFGLGFGNCGYSSSFSFLTSPFYIKYNYLHYYYFHGIWALLETGFIGLIFLFGFFVLVAVFSVVRFRKVNEGEKPYYQISIILCCIAFLCILYNTSLRNPAGYMMYAFIALPFSGCIPEKGDESVSTEREGSFKNIRLKKEQNKSRHKICFAASSGGHFEQLLMLKPLMVRYDSFILTEKTTYDIKISGMPQYFLPQVNRKGILFPIKMIYVLLKSGLIFIKEKPDIVITTGVLAIIPMALICKLSGGHLIYIESFAKVSSPTKTGKFLYKYADCFYVQWESMLKIYPDAVFMGSIY